MTALEHEYPFSAIMGQESMKTALLLNMINPRLGGVLIRGEKGTAKSTAVRAVAGLLEDMKVVNLPVSATEDRVVGTLDIQHAIQSGEKRFEPGLLAQADKQILYVDEINLLDDHIVDVLLDAAASGINTVEREGISHSHAARFILIGTMNPEEGDLRPQLLDRFALSVEVKGEKEISQRVEVVRRRMDYEADPYQFIQRFRLEQDSLTRQIRQARERLPKLEVSDDIIQKAAEIALALQVDGHRSDITMIKTAVTLAAYNNNDKVELSDLYYAAMLAMPHRLKRIPFGELEDSTDKIHSVLHSLGLASL
ncbi:magnesium chelatase [Paenibacillus sp. PK3_47]|uniref:ATP-binding protein n=1 Tax=Paenibacillus sp. PK3_47 TaxID=2072642 RepID=UPI00201E0DCF|nr:AAA family ATPase [Paenibacillus sp. PK3_47]UQZ37004.1 magnesium chelatase [Paenibacillus sp. PK3_47]